MLHAASRGRLLVIVSQHDVRSVLAEHAERPIVALLTSHVPIDDPQAFDPLLTCLLDAGCAWFVCFGETSELLHDLIDELIVGPPPKGSIDVTTTWHDDEPAADVVEFFFTVGGAKEATLLVAVVDPEDAELIDLLVTQAAA